MHRVPIKRRSFVKAAAASVAAPLFWARRSPGAEDVNSRLTFAAIGVGGSRSTYGRGGRIASNAAKLGQLVAVCDVDALHAKDFAAKFDHKIKLYGDYRELLDKEKVDIVTVGTPDHWHVPISIAAMKAGRDVYCEKPLTLTIDEGKQISKVVKDLGKVFQVGSQQRTEYDQVFLKAIALAQSGRLGDNLQAHVAIGGTPEGKILEASEPPEGLDWDFWLGPAPKVPYCEGRRTTFRWWLEYSGGKMTDWGAHHIDIAQWALGCDKTGPVEIEGTGVFPSYIPEYDPKKFLDGEITLPNGFNTAMSFNIELKYANGNVMTVHDKYTSPDGEVDFPNGILLEGDKGRIFVNRGRLSGKPAEELSEADNKWLDEEVVKLYRGKTPTSHMENFFNCVKDRSLPISDVFTHHRSMTSCHLCNIAILLGRKLKWDPEKEVFVGDDQANSLLWRKQREPYVTEV